MKQLYEQFNRMLKNNKNSSFVLFIIFFISGYTFFLSSYTWFPSVGTAKNFTSLDTTLTLDNHDLTLKNWTWCEQQNLMEVEIDVINNNYDGNDKYLFSCRDQQFNSLEVTPVIEDKNLLVYHIKVPEGFKELSFRIKIDKGNENTKYDNMIRFYTNSKIVDRVNKIESLSINEYYIQRLERTIVIYNKEIGSYQKYIDELDNKISTAKQEINRLTETINLLSSDDTEKTEKRIETIKNSITDFQSEKTKTEESIFTIQDKITETTKKLEQYKK